MRIQSFAGLFVLAMIAWGLSENRKAVSWRIALYGILVQLVLAAIMLKVPLFKEFFLVLNRLVSSLEEASRAGTSFVFGYLGGGALPFDEKSPGASFILALQALPLVLVVSALSSLLFFWRILPVVVKAFSRVLEKTLNIGGALGLATASNIFIGMVESPLVIKPYLREMSRSELFSVMVCGMATIAGTVMVLYASILRGVIPDAMGHILIASLISAPAAITVSRLMIPETGKQTAGKLMPPQAATGSMDAITRGTLDGLELLLNIVAMLIVLVALVHLANLTLTLLPDIGGSPVTLQRLLGYVMAPIVWLMGIPWAEASTAGALMGTKTILNEFIAYVDLANLPEGALSPRSRLIMTYALCGFANFGSLGIMIGGLGSIVPERKDEVVALGMRAIVGGTLATSMTGAIVGLFYTV
ncbi:Nucleoside permease NupC [hydrothermal vent metagenome]|uniref:Nucleoside permease NupC n=1 Tax=hydrothermal vent metagenome TaxID=652676 RepID=A0A3B1CWJ3_9ZZZZ